MTIAVAFSGFRFQSGTVPAAQRVAQPSESDSFGRLAPRSVLSEMGTPGHLDGEPDRNPSPDEGIAFFGATISIAPRRRWIRGRLGAVPITFGGAYEYATTIRNLLGGESDRWIRVDGDSPYTASVHTLIDTALSGSGTLRIVIVEWDSPNRLVSEHAGALDAGAHGWERGTDSFVTRPSTAGVTVRVQGDGVTGVVLKDGWQLETGGHATGYVDGSLAAGYSWMGYPWASPATREAGRLRIPTILAPTFRGSVVGWVRPLGGAASTTPPSRRRPRCDVRRRRLGGSGSRARPPGGGRWRPRASSTPSRCPPPRSGRRASADRGVGRADARAHRRTPRVVVTGEEWTPQMRSQR